MSAKPKILFICKKDDFYADKAQTFLKASFPDAQIVIGRRSDPLPEEIKPWSGDSLFSYLSPWIIPAETLKRASKAAINFHPGPPEYPGIGCTNFAIYNNES